MNKEKMEITCEELPDVIITKATSKEIKKIQNAFKIFSAVKEYDKHFLYHLNNYCFRAARNNKTLGFMLLAPKSPDSKENEILHLSLVYVFGKYRLRGIGSFLFFAAHGISRAMGYKSIYLDIAKNLPDSKPFCEAMFNHMRELGGTVKNSKLEIK